MDAPPVKLAELLRHPDDLDKISTLRQEFARKKAAIDSQLRAGLREQLETTQSGMSGLSEGQRAVQQIKEEMQQIDRLCSESQNMIQDFATINLVSQAQRNFAAVETMRRHLETFGERLARVEAMLEADDGDAENMPNLLSIHYELTQLRNIRDDAMEQMARADDASLQATLEDYFSTRLDAAIDWFDEHVGLVATSLVSLVTAENNGLVVRFALVIEAEERSDARVQALRDALRDHREMASRFQGLTDGAAKTVRGYKDKFLLAIRAYAEAQLAETRELFLEDPSRLEKSLRWFFNDLNAVRLGMVPLMPPKWHIMRTYTGIYHGLMHDFLIELVDGNDPAVTSAHTLEIINWPEKYYRKMAKLGFTAATGNGGGGGEGTDSVEANANTPAIITSATTAAKNASTPPTPTVGIASPDNTLSPHVLDHREAELVREFRQLIIRFLDEWIDRIGGQERREFAERAAPGVDAAHLDTDEYGYFRTRNVVDLWRMLREQLDVAAHSQRADVVEGVVDAMFARLRTRQGTVQKMLDDEAQRYEAGRVPELEGFQALQDWLVATANDQIACIDDGAEAGGDAGGGGPSGSGNNAARSAYLSSFRNRIEPLVSAAYMERVDAEVAALRDGYVDLSTWCLGRFASLIFAVDFRAVLPDFFTARWYGAGTGMRQMAATLEEYVADYRQVLHHSLVDVFVEILSDELLVRYLAAVRNKGAKLRRADPFQDQIFADVAAVFDMFDSVAATGSGDAAALKNTWRVTEQFLALLTAPKDAVPDTFAAFKTTYWDLHISWVEAVLRVRDDFDRAMLNAVKARAAQISVERGPETIMSKVK